MEKSNLNGSIYQKLEYLKKSFKETQKKKSYKKSILKKFFLKKVLKDYKDMKKEETKIMDSSEKNDKKRKKG